MNEQKNVQKLKKTIDKHLHNIVELQKKLAQEEKTLETFVGLIRVYEPEYEVDSYPPLIVVSL